ncbi:MAG TPA: hypothetical protein VER33_14680 [Polyangiaceae bacterium]|nr:hypothetical protein [Polyangiaceae bacterium]
MNKKIRTLGVVIAVLGYSQVIFAALDTPDGGGAPCGADGACNLGACSNDPDCPDWTDDPPAPPQPDRPGDILDCTSQERNEIGLAVDYAADNWSSFEAFAEDFMSWPVNLKSCLENRFDTNGKVVCESSATGMCSTAMGWASPFNRKAHLCPGFLDDIADINGDEANRQACYFALLVHEWGHTCERGHVTLEILDDVAFDWWKERHESEVTIDYADCSEMN